MTRFHRILMLSLLMLAAGTASAGRYVELVNPPPVAVPAGLGQDQVAKDIKRALITRGWVVALEEPGHLESTLNLRDHVARIDIKFDTREVAIAYLDSRNLGYEKKRGKAVIHRNYLSWIDNIVRDLSTNLQLSATGQ